MSTHRLAVLVCDHVMQALEDAHGDLRQIFDTFLAASLARVNPDANFTLDGYDVVNGEYPADNAHYQGVLITGSRASAYEDVEWINALVAYVKRIVVQKPAMKIFGICFGHQIIARALGGTCVPNNGVWEVSVTSIKLSPIGKAIFDSDHLDIQQMHRDHVPTAPPNAHVLGSSDITPNHGMVILHDGVTPDPTNISLTSIHVLTLQGHPEFTKSIMTMLLDARIALLGEDLVRDAHMRSGGVPGKHYPGGLACDGISKVGRVIWGVLGVAPATRRARL